MVKNGSDPPGFWEGGEERGRWSREFSLDRVPARNGAALREVIARKFRETYARARLMQAQACAEHLWENPKADDD